MMKKLAAFIFLCLYCLSPVFAQTIAEGQHLDPFTLTDQFEKSVTINNETRAIIFSREKSTANLVKKAYETIPVKDRHQAETVFISDISNMPGMISRFIAIPALKERDYQVLLDKEGEKTRQFPSREGKLTLILLDNKLRIKKLTYLDSVDTLKPYLIANESN
jgi:hypothetical protein